MTENEQIFMKIILAIEAERGDVWSSDRNNVAAATAIKALDKVEREVREIAKFYGCLIPEPGP